MITTSTEFKHFKRIYKEATPIAILTVIAELFAGVALAGFERYYLLLPGILLIVPGMMESRGNIITSLSKRLGTSVHLGIVKIEYGINKEIIVNFLATIILNVLAAIGMGTLGYLAAVTLGIPHITLLGFLFSTLFMALIVGTLLSALTIIVVFLATYFNLDPDNVTIPVIATIGDITTVSFIYVLVETIFWLNQRLPVFI